MIASLLFLIGGFIILIAGANILIDGASGIAKRFGLSNLVIGSTIVALGTSLPEMVVNLFAASQGNTDLAITNIVGSNIINTFVILGLTAFVCPIAAAESFRRFDIPMSVFAGFIILVMLEMFGAINASCGLILLAGFAIYMFRMVVMSKSGEKEVDDIKPMGVLKALLFIVGGILGLSFGGQFVVDGAISIAKSLGASEAVIGLTVVALGTSLPELVTSVMAAVKKNTDLAIGNVIGSNIFNVYFVLGVSSLLHPLPSYNELYADVLMAVVGSALVWIFVSMNSKHCLRRIEGLGLVCLYALYIGGRLLQIYLQ